MRKFYLVALTLLMVIANQTKAQTGFAFNCARDTVINGCSAPCLTLKSRIPDIHASTSSYLVNPISGAGGCFVPYVSPNAPGNPTSLSIDDRYTNAITLPFTFPFFGTPYTQLIASTNGLLSFDISKANGFSHYGILNSGGFLSATTGTPQDLPSTLYDKALIMGPYHDLDPAYTTSPTQLIKYDVLGTAPHRRWILSFYKVPLFLSGAPNNCDLLIQNTHQIVLYESLGIVEVFLNDMQQCPGWNQGRSMVGLQDINRTNGIMAPGRKASDPVWGTVGMNESWRFVPAGGPTLYKKVELFTLGGTLVATGDTTRIDNSTFEVAFPSVCPPGTTTYIIKSTYNDPGTPGGFVYGTDTVRVVAANPLSATYVPVEANCSNNFIGSVTLTVSGSPGPFEYSIDGGLTWQPSSTFNEPAGNYTILYRIIGNTCNAVLPVTIPLAPNGIAATYVITNIKCNGGSDGSINVTATGGVAPIQYSKDGGTNYQPTGLFSPLSAGVYNIRIKDAANCYRDTVITITQPAALTATVAAIVNATCSAVPNGTITVTAGGGTPAYSYSTDGVTFQTPSPVLTVTNGSYTVTVKDNNNCIKTINGVIVPLTRDITLQSRLDTTVCLGASVRLNTVTNATSFGWSGDPGLDDITLLNPLATPTTTPVTRYIISADLGQCNAKDTVDITVIKTVTVDAGPNVTILAGDHTTLFGTVTNASTFLWTSDPIGTSLSSTTVLGPVATPLVTTTYTLTASNSLGCFASDDVVVTVVPVCVSVANAFTPNGDGDHDTWNVYRQYDCLKNVSVHVFNRYGSKVYESKDYHNGWDGRFEGKSLPDGTYYGVIEFTLITGEIYRAKTDITILR